MRKLLFIVLIATAVQLSAQTKIETKAEKVTVFLDGAQVTRTKTITVPAGKSVYQFTGLSPYLDTKSVQFQAGGAVTLLSMTPTSTYRDTTMQSETIRKIQQKLDETDNLKDKLWSEKKTLEAEEAMLNTNLNLKGSGSNLSLDLLKQFSSYYTSRIHYIKERIYELDEQIENSNNQTTILRNRLSRTKDGRGEQTGMITAEIDAAQSTSVTFRITYYVKNAEWQPAYDIRCSQTNRPIDIIFKANIVQKTKENWDNVQLTLSTAKPTANATMRGLIPYTLTSSSLPPDYRSTRTSKGQRINGRVVGQAGSLAGASVKVSYSGISTRTDANGRFSITLPVDDAQLVISADGYKTEYAAAKDDMTVLMKTTGKSNSPDYEYIIEDRIEPILAIAEEAAISSIPLQVEEKTNYTAHEYAIKRRYTIPSEDEPFIVEVRRYSQPTDYEYRCAPRVSSDAFLFAKMRGVSGLNLMNAEANIYYNNMFVGNAILEGEAARDTVNISLGKETDILATVSQTNKKEESRLGGNKLITAEYTINVENNRNGVSSLVIYDQIPVSGSNDIVIEPLVLDSAELNTETGILSWALKLQPQQKRTVKYSFSVKAPKETPIRF